MRPTFVLPLLLTVLLEKVSGDGKLWMKLVSFVNPGGKGDNGHFCDGKFFIRGSDCDHRFIICLDSAYGNNNVNHCKYGRIDTGEIGEFNSRTFGSRVGRMINPTSFRFISWPGSMKIKVKIIDVDDNDDDFVDYITSTFYGPLYRTYAQADRIRITIRRRVRLLMDLFAYCNPDYYGSTCSVHCKARDDNFSHYTCDKRTGAKICNDGWKGKYCHISTDNCLSSPCKHGGVCENRPDDFICHCQVGYTGLRCETDIDECQSNPCQNHGVCRQNVIAGYTCSCTSGWKGSNCELDINECTSTPCLNNGTCQNTEGSYYCVCFVSWLGQHCGEDADECKDNPCHSDASCLNTQGSFACFCPKGLAGTYCKEDINECETNPCYGNASCINEHGTYRCVCEDGWRGSLCDEDINECLLNLCQFNSTCQNMNGTFQCHCPEGREGKFCQDDINECISSPCLHNSSCENYDGSFLCQCQQGFTGEFCEININECEDDPCYHFGICTDLLNDFSCACTDGWTGKTCETEIDECQGTETPVRLKIQGYVNISQEEVLRESIVKILVKKIGGTSNITKVLLSSEYENTDNISVVTTVDVAAYVEDRQICEHKLMEILQNDHAYMNTLPWPAKLESSNLRENDVNLRNKKKEEKHSWLIAHWYIVLVIAAVLIAFVIVIAIIQRRRKRSKMDIPVNYTNNGPSHNGSLPLPPEGLDGELNGTSLSFDNVLYTTFQPQETSRLMDPTSTKLPGCRTSSDDGFCSSSNCAEEGLYCEPDDECVVGLKSETDDCCAMKVKCSDDSYYSEIR